MHNVCCGRCVQKRYYGQSHGSCFHDLLEQLQQLHLWTWEGPSEHPMKTGKHQGVSNIDFEIIKQSTVFSQTWAPTKNTKSNVKKCVQPLLRPILVHSCTVGEPPRFAAVERPFFWLPWKDLSLYRLRLNCCRGWLGCSGGHKQILKVLKYVLLDGAKVANLSYLYGKSSCCPASSTKMVVLHRLK